jgi:hypothetical protein
MGYRRNLVAPRIRLSLCIADLPAACDKPSTGAALRPRYRLPKWPRDVLEHEPPGVDDRF